MSIKRLFEIISAILVLLLAYGGLTKLLDHKNFVDQLIGSPLYLSDELAQAIAWTVAFTQFTAAALIVRIKTRPIGMILSLMLMTFFTTYVGIIAFTKIPQPCNCLGIVETMSWHTHFWFNITFTILAAIGTLPIAKETTRYVNLA